MGEFTWNVFVKPLSKEGHAIRVLNLSDKTKSFNMNLSKVGLPGSLMTLMFGPRRKLEALKS